SLLPLPLCAVSSLFRLTLRLPLSTLFPYTTLFRSPYHYENFECDGWAYYTNSPPAGAFRGFGVTQTCFAVESLLNEMADKIGIRSEEHTSELQSRFELVCRLLLEKNNK